MGNRIPHVRGVWRKPTSPGKRYYAEMRDTTGLTRGFTGRRLGARYGIDNVLMQQFNQTGAEISAVSAAGADWSDISLFAAGGPPGRSDLLPLWAGQKPRGPVRPCRRRLGLLAIAARRRVGNRRPDQRLERESTVNTIPLPEKPEGDMSKALGNCVDRVARRHIVSNASRRSNERNVVWEYPTMLPHSADRRTLDFLQRGRGPKDAPTLLLLHGLPSSSRMFEPLFLRLSEHYHLGGAGLSRASVTAIGPIPKTFSLHVRPLRRDHEPFHRVASGSHATRCTCRTTAGRWAFRMALTYPDRIEAPHRPGRCGAQMKGLGANWNPRAARFWADRVANESTLRTNSSLARQPRGHDMSATIRNVDRYDPDPPGRTSFAFLNQPGQSGTFRAISSTTTAQMSRA